jgi:hypothetical protein
VLLVGFLEVGLGLLGQLLGNRTPLDDGRTSATAGSDQLAQVFRLGTRFFDTVDWIKTLPGRRPRQDRVGDEAQEVLRFERVFPLGAEDRDERRKRGGERVAVERT